MLPGELDDGGGVVDGTDVVVDGTDVVVDGDSDGDVGDSVEVGVEADVVVDAGLGSWLVVDCDDEEALDSTAAGTGRSVNADMGGSGGSGSPGGGSVAAGSC